MDTPLSSMLKLWGHAYSNHEDPMMAGQGAA